MEEGERLGAYARDCLARGDKKQAYTMFTSAATALHKASESETDPVRNRALRERTAYYLDCAEALAPKKATGPAGAASSQSVSVRQYNAAARVHMQARLEHEQLRYNEARRLYMQAVELYLKCNGSPEEVQARTQAEVCLKGAELMSSILFGTPLPAPTPPVQASKQASGLSASKPPSDASVSKKGVDGGVPASSPSSVSVHDLLKDLPSVPSSTPDFDSDVQSPPRALSPIEPAAMLTPAEREVLAFTSRINGREYMPWIDQDLQEAFRSASAYTDPDGPLRLSTKQQALFAKWVRPSQVSKNPQMIIEMTSKCIKQTVVPNCSFVSSLAITADFEKRFKKPIVSKCLFPQKGGQPVYNPHGKYMVKLFINGVWRKIIIDDTLPLGTNGSLLCAHSIRLDEFWVSVIEKAYLKVMGGYDFPGSNSGIDLHALSGWIPERISLKDATESTWERVWRGLHQGDALVTIATGLLSDADSQRTGLVPTHAYALLDIRLTKTLGLIKLKNPWNQGRWKGAYSPSDKSSWTSELRAGLKYDPDAESLADNGEFWIDLKSLQRFFDVMYLNWNSDLFKHGDVVHDCWQQSKGPVKDVYNLGFNPQYSLHVQGSEASVVRVLLSRHITEISDFANNEEYITVHVYRGGKRVYYPDDAYAMGVKINSPHYTVSLNVPTGEHNFTLIVSQYEKSTTLRYTLRAYSTVPCKLRAIPPAYPPGCELKITSQWTSATAGGSLNDLASFERNPKFTLVANSDCDVFIKLEAPKTFSVAICVRSEGSSTITTGAYRPGFCYLELAAKKGVVYTVIPSSFNKNEIGPFFLTAGSKAKFSLKAA